MEDEILNISAHGSKYSNLAPDEQEALRNLSRDDSIVIKGADKGSAVVVWDKEDYLKESENHLGDSNTSFSRKSKTWTLLSFTQGT